MSLASAALPLDENTASLRVLLVGNYLIDEQQSMLRYADMLLAGLRARGVDARLIRPELRVGRLRPGNHGLGKWLGYVDKFILFPRALRRTIQTMGPRTVVHICDSGNAMYVRHLQDWPHLVTCHDVLAIRSALGHFPQSRVSATGRFYQRLIVAGLRRARRVVCDSEETRRQLLSLGGLEAAQVSTVLIGQNHPYRPFTPAECVSQLAGLPDFKAVSGRSFIFHVGGNQWYKNRPGVLRIYFEYIRQGGQLPLVMAGKLFTDDMKVLLSACPPGGRVVQVPGVSNEELNALYSSAACLLFPSLQEGFGWPVLEALAAGCRVVTTNRAPMTEVGGPAAYYAEAENDAAAAQLLLGVLAEPPAARHAREAAGLAWAARFSTRQMTADYLRLYGQLLGGQPATRVPSS